jgi:hypothetical protein
MDRNGLTPSQEQLFRTLEMIDHNGAMSDNIAHAKKELRRDNVIRGGNPVKGFTVNE